MIPVILFQRKNSLVVMNGRLSLALIAAVLMIIVLMGYQSAKWLPDKYTLDQFTITVFKIFAEELIKGNSYNNTALVYNWLGVDKTSEWFKGLVTLVYCGFAVFAVSSTRPRYLTPGSLLIMLGGCFASAVYLSPLSKEFIVLLVVLVFYVFCHRRWSSLLWLGVAAGYAYYFRGYWYLVIALYLWLVVIGFYAKTPGQLIVVILSGLLAISILHPLLIGGSIMNYRDGVNAGREGAYARTLIKPVLSSRTPLADWINCSLIWAQTVIPIRLLFSTSPQHILSGLMMLSTFTLIFRGIFRFWQQTVQDPAIFRCLCLFLSFTAVQSTFEPDYGSMLKHMTPLLPLALVFICSQFRSARALPS